MNATALPGLFRDRRGLGALAFAVTGMALLGMVGLAAEAGTWYLTRARVQDAADAAALAAVMADVAGTDPSAAARQIASRNGFRNGIALNTPPATCFVSGSACSTAATTPAQFEAVLNVSLTPYLSKLFTAAMPQVQAHGVAALRDIGPECMLSLAGRMTILASQVAPQCIYGSNATGDSAVSISGGSAVTLASITTTGDCGAGCADALLARPYVGFQPPSADPYAGLAAVPSSLPPCGTITASGATVTLTPGLYSTADKCPADSAWLASTTPPTFTLGAPSQTWVLRAGTYIFSDVSLAITAGAIECRAGAALCAAGSGGVAILLTGTAVNTIGSLRICNAPTGSCTGPTQATFAGIAAQNLGGGNPLSGILIYRDGRGAAGSPAVWIWGNAGTTMNGALYFPGANVFYGNPASAIDCAVVVAGTLTLRDTTTRSDATTGCARYGTTPPQARAARLLE
jgi:Flp pilus assembly protein TadG